MPGPYPELIRRHPKGPGLQGGWWCRPAAALLVHPELWCTAAIQLARLAAPGWWRRRPFLPMPDPDYLGFRLQTAYGDATCAPAAQDLISYLRWCRAWPRLTR